MHLPPSPLPEHMLLLALLRKLRDEDAIYSRERIEPHLPQLAGFGTALWAAAFSRMHTRDNRYLFLNAPELWEGMDVADWQQVMRLVGDRSYAAGDVFSTGRFDDIKCLCHLVGVDGVALYFRTVLPASEELRTQRSWVGRHVRACTLMYLPMTDPDDEVDHFHTTPDRLVAYRDRLLQRYPDLSKAISDEEQLRGELTTFLG